MLRLMRFGVYFERILKIKWLFSYRNNYSIVTRIGALGARGHMLPEKSLKIWCSLVRFGVYFSSDGVLKNSLKINIFWIKNNTRLL